MDMFFIWSSNLTVPYIFICQIWQKYPGHLLFGEEQFEKGTAKLLAAMTLKADEIYWSGH